MYTSLTLQSPVITPCTNRFNIKKFYVLPTQYIYVFCMGLRTKGDYFPMQHQMIGFYNRDISLYSSVVTICTIRFNIQQFYVLPTVCIYVLYGSQNKQPLFPYTSLTAWFLQLRRSLFTARYELNL